MCILIYINVAVRRFCAVPCLTIIGFFFLFSTRVSQMKTLNIYIYIYIYIILIALLRFSFDSPS